MKLKRGSYEFWLFFKIDPSPTSFERSRRELFINVAEHRSILKNNQNTYQSRFSFTPKTGVKLPETGDLFSLWTTHHIVSCWRDVAIGLCLECTLAHGRRGGNSVTSFLSKTTESKHSAVVSRMGKAILSGSCHKRQKPQAPIRNRQTRKVANAKGLNRNTNLT